MKKPIDKMSPHALNEYLGENHDLNLFDMSLLWFFAFSPNIKDSKNFGGVRVYDELRIRELRSKDLDRIKNKLETLKKKTIETLIEAKSYAGELVPISLFRSSVVDFEEIKHLYKNGIFNEKFINLFSMGFNSIDILKEIGEWIGFYNVLSIRRKNINKWVNGANWLIAHWAFYIEKELKERIDWELLADLFTWFSKKSMEDNHYIEDIQYLREQYCRYKEKHLKFLNFNLKNFKERLDYYPRIVFFDKTGIYLYCSEDIRSLRQIQNLLTSKEDVDQTKKNVNTKKNDKITSFLKRIEIILDLTDKHPKIKEVIIFPDHSHIAR